MDEDNGGEDIMRELTDESIIQGGRHLDRERKADIPPEGFTKRTMERLNRKIPLDSIPASKANDDQSGQ